MVLAPLSSGEGRAAFTNVWGGVHASWGAGLLFQARSRGINSPHLSLSFFLNSYKFFLLRKQLGKCLQAEGVHLTPWMGLCIAFLFCPERSDGQEEGRKDVRAFPNPTPYPEKAALDNVPTAKGHRERGEAELLHTTSLCSLCPAVTDKGQRIHTPAPGLMGTGLTKPKGMCQMKTSNTCF